MRPRRGRSFCAVTLGATCVVRMGTDNGVDFNLAGPARFGVARRLVLDMSAALCLTAGGQIAMREAAGPAASFDSSQVVPVGVCLAFQAQWDAV